MGLSLSCLQFYFRLTWAGAHANPIFECISAETSEFLFALQNYLNVIALDKSSFTHR